MTVQPVGVYVPRAHIEELHDGRYVCWMEFNTGGQSIQVENLMTAADGCRSLRLCFDEIADVVSDSGHDGVVITRHRKEA